MNLPIEQALNRLSQPVNGFDTQFQTVFGGPNPVSEENLLFALASYVRSLTITPNTPLEGNGKGLSHGKARCSSCHNGANFTDEQFHNIGVDSSDIGLAAISGRTEDIGKFKTPTLWAISSTGPYFHDGSASSLIDVIGFYNEGGDVKTNLDFAIKPLGLTAGEKMDLLAYLNSLTGTIPN